MWWRHRDFRPLKEIFKRDFSPVSDVGSPLRSSHEITPMAPYITVQVSKPEYPGTCLAVPESLDQATLPSSSVSVPSVTPVPDYFLRRLDDISSASRDINSCFPSS